MHKFTDIVYCVKSCSLSSDMVKVQGFHYMLNKFGVNDISYFSENIIWTLSTWL